MFFSSFHFQPKCTSQNKEVVQWLEFPPSLRIGHGHTVSGLPEYITTPPPLVDFALYFIALFLYLGEQCIRVILRYQGGHTLLPRYQHQTKAAMIKGGLFCKGFVVVAAYFHKSQDMVTQIHCDVQWSTDVPFGSRDTDTVEI